MLVGAVQFLPKPGEFSENFKRMLEYLEEGAKLGLDLVLFPELTVSGYTLDGEVLRKGWDFTREILGDVLRISREHDMAIVFGAPRVVSGRVRNSVVVVKKKREILFYDKTHLFRGEKEVFEPGEDFEVFKFKGVIFGISVCYETAFPEISRVLTLRGAKVILSPFAFGKERWRIYDVATRSRAIENGSFLVASSTNGVGFMEFVGHSRIVHPSGEILAELEEEDGLVHSRIDVEVTHKYRYLEIEDSHAYLSNRKPHMYRDVVSYPEGEEP